MMSRALTCLVTLVTLPSCTLSHELDPCADDSCEPEHRTPQGEGEGEGDPGLPISSLVDEFDDGDLLPLWLASESGGCEIRDSGGGLSTSLPAGPGASCRVLSVDLWDLRGGEVVIEVPPITNYEADTRYALGLQRDNGDWAELAFLGGAFVSRAHEVGSGDSSTDSAYPPEPWFWRLRDGRDGTLRAESSLDDQTWQEEASLAVSGELRGLRVYIEASTGPATARAIGIGAPRVFGR